MTTDDMHRPTPEFRAHLEWEVTHTFRRESRLADERRELRARQARWLRAAAIVLLSVALGTTAGLASAQIREGSQRDSLLEAARADALLASTRLDLARQQLADVKRKFDVGVLSQASLASAESEVRAMEAQVMRARYNIEEITAASQAPRDNLNAPIVDGRDFVKDRIQLELMAAQQRLTSSETALAEAERRARVGATTELTRLDAEGDLTRARAAMAVLAERLKLRREFVEKGTSVDQLLRRLQDAELRQDAFVAQHSLELARQRVAMLERQRAVGAVGELDVMKAQVEMKEREIELQRLASRLRGVVQPPRDSIH